MSEDRRDTEALLRASHAGSREALDALLAENLDWLRARVKARLGAELRDLAETADYVQDVLVDVLRCGPRFVTRDVAQARALLARIVENVLSDRFHWFHAAKRSREGMAVPASDTERFHGGLVIAGADGVSITEAMPAVLTPIGPTN